MNKQKTSLASPWKLRFQWFKLKSLQWPLNVWKEEVWQYIEVNMEERMKQKLQLLFLQMQIENIFTKIFVSHFF